MARKKKQDEVFDHDFDGIQEYDNDMPSWWINLFWITIVFALVYLLWFHVTGIGDSSTVRYMKQVDENYTRMPGDQGSNLLASIFKPEHSPWYVPCPEVTQASLFGAGPATAVEEVDEGPMDSTVVMLADDASLATGKAIYDQYCFSCHGKFGEGGIGPNMTDEYWLYGGSFPEVVHRVKKGVPLKGMIAWERSISPDQVIQVSSYVMSLQGTNPPNGKAPQGEVFVAAVE